MYGTIARLQVKPGALGKLQEMGQRQQANSTNGFVGGYIYQMDNDSNELYMVVMFESKEKYFANANSPEQNTEFNELMQYLEREPEWHDGEIIAQL
jgi:quinol monooxygenase YgiN